VEFDDRDYQRGTNQVAGRYRFGNGDPDAGTGKPGEFRRTPDWRGRQSGGRGLRVEGGPKFADRERGRDDARRGA